MKKILLAGALACTALFANEVVFDPKSQDHIVINMEQLGEKGNVAVGEVVAIDTSHGVAFFPNLKGIASGIHGFHVHENPDCGATEKGLGMKAGGHWDPEGTKKHSFAWDDKGHKGDLPVLIVDAEGNAIYPVLAPKIKSISELKGRSLMIHVGGDNHHDHPKPLGGGGARMICGVIK
ncbi:superoxide dismutase family protein [Campylobacter sp. RM9344]|uniref:Superoxide dismutase family protein n=1 Tax=Campylobacter californiensis TaxID=1032243 RepID=A0AAW3ZTD4_9BACT|nr:MULTISPECIES: superoxide dismutase family protein [unclassified Campylobacter]MBE2983757.1 superoxide dismutase family protein [Campylobacter sp. RM6883]MBE2985679.1 superoxide dismutase family protein [Campylobacter sp. RM12919]MBE2987292.1 superoxide dismutase family protein [Campylobacter sp. RM12920]MBE2994296.1 superoxide dismutase family protein [Campylobacter sp. RM6913]MBE3028604.1 superoxide dismutase family protein [Campylobacter sp. RM9344]